MVSGQSDVVVVMMMMFGRDNHKLESSHTGQLLPNDSRNSVFELDVHCRFTKKKKATD